VTRARRFTSIDFPELQNRVSSWAVPDPVPKHPQWTKNEGACPLARWKEPGIWKKGLRATKMTAA